MKAIQCVEWGLPERLRLVELPLPEPRAGEVRIRIEAAGVNFPDALIVQKKYQLQPALPFTPGTEVAGTIDAVGADVKRLKPGDRVGAFVGLGGFAEFGCAPAAMTAGTALMDVRTRRWREEAVVAIDPGLAAKLPIPAHPSEPAGVVKADVARQLGLPAGVVVSGSGDNMMGAIGTGNVADGIVTASLGTSGTIYACSRSPIVDPAGEVAAFCDATGQWLPLVCTMNVTVATEMVRAMFGLDHAALSEAAASVDTGADGLLLIPFFEGERTPNVPDGTGVWLGMRGRRS